MLEIKDLTKVYKSKGGTEVRALDGVSVKFEEKGMVFLLGKSGSGKSTLLNLCGGLDAPDSGEIIIKGRSSKDFSQSDFDSYRNTFVGFVFQEYNILDEFTVEDNIALALELQGKNKNKKEVAAILEQVELSNFAKRKPNTLSGGQKQRVAIARALVKNPEIIMADEPTGALDSNTGKQVFDTLKKLSEEKLVIVVSHDREFAEIYGDRIIELKDGKIISDVTKTKIAATPASDNVSFVGEDTISIKSGSKLSKSDIDKINSFLAASTEDVIITNGKKEIADFRKAARIDENGAREAFKDTEEEKLAAKAYAPEDSRFIRSKLPVRHAIRIGASGMKIKPFRLLFTILLSFVAFTLFGLFSTLAFYNATETSLNTYLDSGYDSLMLKKKYEYVDVRYENGEETYRNNYRYQKDTNFTPAELAEYRKQYGEGAVATFTYSNPEYTPTFTPVNVGADNKFNSNYYDFKLNGFAELGSSFYGNLLTSETDLSSLGANDIIISSYTFDSLKAAKLYDDAEKESAAVALSDYNSIIGKKLFLSQDMYSSENAVELTIRGVFQCDPPEEYDDLKTQQGGQSNDAYAFTSSFAYNLCKYALVSEAFYEAHYADFVREEDNMADYGFEPLYRSVSATMDGSEGSQNINQVNSLPPSKGAQPSVLFFDGRTDATLKDGEIVLSYGVASGYLDPWNFINDLRTQAGELQNQGAQTEAQELRDLANQIEQHANQMPENYSQILNSGTISENDPITGDWLGERPATEEEIAAACKGYADYLAYLETLEESEGIELMPALQYSLMFEDLSQEIGTYTVVGFYYGSMAGQYYSAAYLSANDCASLIQAANKESGGGSRTQEETKYVVPEDAIYAAVSIPFPEQESLLRTLIQADGKVDAETDSLIVINSAISANLSLVNGMIKQLSSIFLYVGITLAAFAMLLLFNFISVSIANKKKEIGILRAVGARSADVFKIFYSESIIITAICFVLAMIASFVVCGALNNSVAGTIGASIFVFGPLSWLVMLGIAVVTSFVATFLPVFNAARRKPVESIRAL